MISRFWSFVLVSVVSSFTFFVLAAYAEENVGFKKCVEEKKCFDSKKSDGASASCVERCLRESVKKANAASVEHDVKQMKDVHREQTQIKESTLNSPIQKATH